MGRRSNLGVDKRMGDESVDLSHRSRRIVGVLQFGLSVGFEGGLQWTGQSLWFENQ